MKTEIILEHLYIESWNTTALILKNRIVVQLFNNKYMSREDCFSHIKKRTKELNEIPWYNRHWFINKPKGYSLEKFEKLYNELELYAKEKFWDKFPHDM